MAKKILILTASPQRDKLIDEMLADKLKAMGNETWVAPCLREGRQKVLELEPDVVVLPPVRNVYSRDFAEQLKAWGCGVATRHTEPSCDWSDFKAMDPNKQYEITGRYGYNVDVELVWGPDEADILNKRKVTFKTVSVGAFVADAYKRPDILDTLTSKAATYDKFGLDKDKKTVVVMSAWGFMDSAPDLQIDENGSCNSDAEGRGKWLQMISVLKKSLPEYNILVSLHPNVAPEPYKQVFVPQGIPVDTDCRAIDLIVAGDIIVHAGSTVAIEAHFLGKPALQYGDQNAFGNWWAKSDSPISKVSPSADSPEKLAEMIKGCDVGTNASPDAIHDLECGRYGLMDGKATERAAELINNLEGKFKITWPISYKDYSQITILRDNDRIVTPLKCSVCDETFYIVNDSWLTQLGHFMGLPKPVIPKYDTCCPWCGARWFRRNK